MKKKKPRTASEKPVTDSSSLWRNVQTLKFCSIELYENRVRVVVGGAPVPRILGSQRIFVIFFFLEISANISRKYANLSFEQICRFVNVGRQMDAIKCVIEFR